jgi:hypothetical protein
MRFVGSHLLPNSEQFADSHALLNCQNKKENLGITPKFLGTFSTPSVGLTKV